MKKLFLFSAVIALASSLVSCVQKSEEVKELTPMEYVESLGLGWNLGNSMDAHEKGVSGETLWHDQAATQATFDSVAAAGFKSVRIPVTWLGHIGEAPDYKLDEKWLNRVVEIAGYAKKAGLKAIVNIHHDGHADSGKADGYTWLDVEAAAKDSLLQDSINTKLAAVWTQIANAFKEEGDWLMFETLNEIHDGNWGNGGNQNDGGRQYAVLNGWNQVAVDAIRVTGGENTKRFIGVPGYVCNPDLTIQNLVLPKDPTPNRLLVAVHSYDPWDYAGSGKHSEWGHTGKDIVPDTDESVYTGMLDRLYDKYVKNGIPVYFGEFGCVHRDNDHAENFRKYYLEYVCKAFRDHKMAAFFWDNGYDLKGDDAFGLMDHGTGKWIANGQEIVKIMVDAYNNNDSTYTLKSIYDRAPKAKE